MYCVLNTGFFSTIVIFIPIIDIFFFHFLMDIHGKANVPLPPFLDINYFLLCIQVGRFH